MASIASSPKPPKNLKIGGIVEPSVRFRWEQPDDSSITGYKIYWRETTSSTWEYSKTIGLVDNYILDGIVIDNFIFGVSSINSEGYESLVVFPGSTFR